MKVYVLDNGILENDRACQIACYNLATVENKHRAAEWVSVPVYSVLIEHPDGLVLFDTGCNPESMTKRWPESNKAMTPYIYTEDQLLPNALKKLGHRPEDIRYVVCSHLHEDHGGCLEYFNESEIFVHEDEISNALKLYCTYRNQDIGAYVLDDISAWLNAKLNWKMVSSNQKEINLLPGLKIINFGSGHTFGMLGLLIELESDQNLLLISDCAFTAENYGPPTVFPAKVYDSLGYVKTIEYIHSLEKKYHAQVWFGHDIEQFTSLRKSPLYYT